jgi:dTMP kinase
VRSRRRPGRLIALEGLDGSGKTTQAARLADRLRQAGHRVTLTAEPTRGPIGRLIRDWIAVTPAGTPSAPPDPGALALLFAADRRQHLATLVEPALKRGEWVVSDRYLLSSLAYQSLAPGLDLAWLAAINRFARPADLTIFLHLPVDECVARLATRPERADIYETASQLRRIDRNYRRGRRHLTATGQRAVAVDARGTIDQVGDRVWAAVEQIENSDTPLIGPAPNARHS